MSPAPPFNGDPEIEKEIGRLAAKHAVRTIIETGAWRGDSTRALAGVPGVFVFSVEINPEYFHDAARNLGFELSGPAGPVLQNVQLVLGDSGAVLPSLIARAAPPVLFYLDAHWEAHSPLLEELSAVARASLAPPPVIVIHDFFNPHQPDYGWDTWDIGPYDFALISAPLEKIYSGRCAYHYNGPGAGGMRRGVIYIEPLSGAEAAASV